MPTFRYEENVYPVMGLDRGMQRHLPQHLIDDRAVWTLENARVDIGSIKPLFTDKVKANVAGTANSACLTLYHSPLTTAGARTHGIILSDTGVNNGSIYKGDTYGTTVTTGGSWSGSANVPPTNYDVNDNLLYFGTNSSNTTNGIIQLNLLTNALTAVGNSGVAASQIKLFEAPKVMFMITKTGEGSLFSSDVNNVSEWASGQAINKQFKSYMASMETISSYLIVYLDTGVYRARYANLPAPWYFEEITPKTGALSYSTGSNTVNNIIVPHNNLHYFISDTNTRSILTFNGSSFNDIGLHIEDHLFNVIGTAGTHFAAGTVYPQKHEIWWYVADDWESPTTERFYIYNYRTKSWSYATLDHDKPTAIRFESFNRRFYSSIPRFSYKENDATPDYYHTVYEVDNETTNRIPAITSKLYDFGIPQIYKRLKRVRLYLSETTGRDFTVRIDHSDYPSSVSTGTTHTVNFGAGVIDIYCDVPGRYFQLYITTAATNTSNWAIDGWEFYYDKYDWK